MKKTLASVLALAIVTSGALSGCTDPETRTQIDTDAKNARQGLQAVTAPAVPAKHYNPLVLSDKVWTGTTALHMTQGVPLPERFEKAHGITIVSAEPMTASEILQAIQTQTGIAIHSSDYLLRPQRSSSAGGSEGNSSGGDTAMPVAYEGSLSGLLDRFVGYFGLNWHYDGTIIDITRLQTKVFTIEALPGSQQVNDGMQDDNSTLGAQGTGATGGAGGSQQSSVTQNSKFSIDIKYWEELEKVLNSMLGGVGNVVVSPSLGTVTVTTNPRVMETIADYLNEENQRLSRQIAVNVEVYSVTLSKGIDFNIAFTTALKRLANFSGNFTGATAPTTVSGFTGGGALSLAILNAPSHTNEVTDVFTALSGIGDTTKVAKFPLITLNNKPVSRRIGKDITYVSSASSTSTGAGTTTALPSTSLTPGTVHQGFSVQLTPRLLDDGRILLQYSLSVIDLITITSFNSVTGDQAATGNAQTQGSSTIQLPQTATRIFVQQSVLKSGSTLFIGGAEENDASQNAQGVGDPNNYALGGGLSSGTTHSMLFFALTPQVLDTPHSEQE